MIELLKDIAFNFCAVVLTIIFIALIVLTILFGASMLLWGTTMIVQAAGAFVIILVLAILKTIMERAG